MQQPVELDLRGVVAALRADVDALIAQFQATLVPIGPPEAVAQFVARLERIAATVVATWIPDLDDRAVIAALTSGAAALDDEAPTAERPTVAGIHAPIRAADLVRLARRSLPRERLEELDRAVRKERSEWEAAARRLKEARKALGLFERRSSEVDDAERVVQREGYEARAAVETLEIELTAALGAFPPMRVRLAALELLGLCAARLPRVEYVIDDAGDFALQGSHFGRALAASALVRLQAATDAAFPDAARAPRALARSSAAPAGPFRAALRDGDAPAPVLEAPDLVKLVSGDLLRWGVTELMDRCAVHGAMLGAIDAAKRRSEKAITFGDRLAFWSDSPAEQAEAELKLRRRWHQEVFTSLAMDALGRVDRISSPHFLAALRDAVLRTSLALHAVSTRLEGGFGSYRAPIPMREPTLASLFAIAVLLGSTWGLTGTKAELAGRVAQFLESASPGPSPFTALVASGKITRALSAHEVVVGVAEGLRQTPFLELMHTHRAHHFAYEADRAGAVQAETRLDFWERLEIFGKSPNRRMVEALEARAALDWASASQTYAQLNDLLDRALAPYPPAQIYFELSDVRAAFERIRSEVRTRGYGRNKQYYAVLFGKAESLWALRLWTRRAVVVFGRLPSSGEVLEHFATRALEER